MNFTIPTGDNFIDTLIGELTLLIKNHGNGSVASKSFVELHKDVTFVDRKSGMMHTFKEFASASNDYKWNLY